MLSQDSKIIVVGGGVFGLSTSLWLARAGYKNITIYDRCPFDKNFYNPSNGCDGASADINKVFRMAYADKVEYQQLAIEARDIWQAWTETVMASSPPELPEGLTPEDKLLHVCGSYFLDEGTVLRGYYKDSLAAMEKTAPEFRKMLFLKLGKDNAAEKARLRKISEKWVEKYRVIDGINNGNTNGFIDIQAGITIADKACVYARFLCEQAGVKFVLGDPQGKLSSLIIEDDGAQKRVKGIKTCDNLSHFGDLVIVAAGSWTASIIPEAHLTVEATAGTVMFIDIPKERQDLWNKFHPDNYPVWSYRKGDGDDRISTPRTKYSKDPIDTVPLYGLSRMKEVIAQGFPELVEFGFTDSRLCWYTDSPDHNYVIDYVPNYSNSLFICTGGSGHAFKFLPILGKHVKNQLERVPDQFSAAWKWRAAEEGKPNNGLLEGETGPREMSRVEMADRCDFKMEKVQWK
ncbi:L-pipecolate oxidase [Tolypocladium ophioglossoides CBS 100239]|uniref:L-pipecolate oxidase n=1 Tax=Tolypocladium ophioglossoides (strain CBS 100239) TaxID=1163406 RepID=A0A0L0NMD4_TOLOC|nr:L-pipecolate oxidase [Tolypocladium ophioglossoides CBS 100239]